MSKRILHYSSRFLSIIFILLFLFALTNFLILYHLMDEADHSFTTTSSFPRITAKSEIDNINIPDCILDKVHLGNLEKTVHDLSSFHTRHTESEFMDNVAYWLTEKLQSICGTEVYVQNFTYAPEKTNDDDEHFKLILVKRTP